MRIFCRKAIRQFEEFAALIESAKRRYPNYIFGGLDEFSMQEWAVQLDDYRPVGFYIIENYEGANYMGFYHGAADLSNTRFLHDAEVVSASELKEILSYKSSYTFRSKKTNSYFALELSIDLTENSYA